MLHNETNENFLSLQPNIQPNLEYTLPPEAFTELAKTKQGDPGNSFSRQTLHFLHFNEN